jgi:pyruvate formate lyase activating enzyme
VKLADAARHERCTARDNEQVLANLRELARRGVPLEVRMPVVPGWNTDVENVAATARLLGELGVGSLTLLPYNHLWEAKLPRLGQERRALGIRPPDDAFYERLRDEFARSGLAARL